MIDRPRWLGALALWGMVLLAGGCESQQTTTASSPLGTSLALYESGDYQQAEQQARDIANRSHGLQRAQASYVAGMAAYQQSKTSAAERHLVTAATARDNATAGRANAMLGIIALAGDRPAQAEPLFKKAGEQLIGRQRDNALRYASLARMQHSGPQPPDQYVSTATGGRFVLQAGAYHDRSRATQASRSLNTMTQTAGLGTTRIIQSSDERGRPLYLVQFGGFRTRGEATRARQELGRLEFIVVSSGT